MDHALYEEHDLYSDAVEVRQLHFVEPFVFSGVKHKNKEEDVSSQQNETPDYVNVSLPNIFPK